MAKHIIITVTNDLVTDQRIFRISQTLLKQGYKITLVGRILKNSQKVKTDCNIRRFKLWFNTGALFYANYNFRLFVYLLFAKYDIVLSNDLDSLPAGYLASKLRKKQLVYDSHEFFTELPELVKRRLQKNVWLWFEQKILPKTKYSYTVCNSIANKYNDLYSANFQTIRNLPLKKECVLESEKNDKHIIIYQGALNIGRGIELMIQAMQFIENAELWIAGNGDIEEELKQLGTQDLYKSKVKFIGRIPLSDLHVITCKASIGLSLEENIGLNYYFALPNKLFDYIQAQIPVLVSDLPEMSAVVNEYKVGEILYERTPEALAQKITDMLSDNNKIEFWQTNLKEASEELIWEKEQYKLVDLFKAVGNDV